MSTDETAGTRRLLLTDDAIRDLAAPGKGAIVIWDTATKGLHLRIAASSARFAGGCRSFYLQSRTATHRAYVISLGRWPETKVADARRRAEIAKRKAADDEIDPAEERRRKRREERERRVEERKRKAAAQQDETIEQLVESFIAGYSAKEHKPSTQEPCAHLLRNYVVPVIGSLKVRETTKEDVEKIRPFMVREAARVTRRTSFDRCIGYLSTAFVWRGFDGSRNPCHGGPGGIKRHGTREIDRYFTLEHLADIGRALDDLATKGREVPVAILKVLAITGKRRDEIRTLQWPNVDLARGTIDLPDSKVGRVTYTLPDAAIEIIASQPRQKGVDWVFPDPGNPKHSCSKGKVAHTWAHVCRLAGIRGRTHDLRSSAATWAASKGAQMPELMDMFGWSNPKTALRYIKRGAAIHKELSRKNGALMASALRGETGIVVPIQRKEAPEAAKAAAQGANAAASGTADTAEQRVQDSLTSPAPKSA